MKKIIFGCVMILLVSLFFISQTSACSDCEIGESIATDKTAYKEGIAQIKEI